MRRRVKLTRIEKLNPAYWGYVLHPTKGWRKPSVRSGHASAVRTEIRTGNRPWSSDAFKAMLAAEGIIE